MPRNVEDAMDLLGKELTPATAPPIPGLRSAAPAMTDPIVKPAQQPALMKDEPGRPRANEQMALGKPANDFGFEEPPSLTQQPAAAPAPSNFAELPLPVAQPTPEQRAGLPADTKAREDGLRGPSGAVKLNAEGRRRFEAAAAKKRAKYGRYWGMNDAKAPQPDIAPGRREFNPYTGQWVED